MSDTSKISQKLFSASASTVRRQSWWPLVILALATMIVVLDTTVMVIALPSAQKALGMSDASRQWVLTAYTVAYGSLLLLGGRLGDRIGRRRALLIGMAGFALASAVAGAAQSAEMLITARAVEGAFGAILVSSTRALLVTTYTDSRQRATALGVFGAVLVGGLSVGFVVGGLLTNYFSWRWCLYINVPVAVIAGIGAVRVLPAVSGHREVRLDIFGAILACAGMGLLVYGLSLAPATGWSSLTTILPLISGLVLLAAFLVRQGLVLSPLLPLRILTDRSRAGSFIALALGTIANLGTLLILTYQLQVVMRDTALIAGVALIPFAAAVATSSAWIAPRLMPNLPPRYVISAGILLCAGGFFLLTRLTPSSSYAPLILSALVVLGLGSGLIAPPSLHTALVGVAAADMGAAAAMSSTSNQIGASIGTALLNSISVSAAAAYLASHPSVAEPAVAAIHGYAVALAWGGGIELVGAILVLLLISVGQSAPTTSR
jgi:EmrB/QacA subfamily drug resistance transporter